MEEVLEQVEDTEIAPTEDHRMTDTTIDVRLIEDRQTADILTDAHLMIEDHEEGGKLCQEATEQDQEDLVQEQVED